VRHILREHIDGGKSAYLDLKHPIRRVRSPLLWVSYTGKVALHSGYPEQPQNCDPALFPLRAVRNTITLPQAEQEGAAGVFALSDRSV